MSIKITMAKIPYIIGLLFCFSWPLQAGMISTLETETGFANESGGFDDNSSPPASFTIELNGLATVATGDGFLNLTTFGDFSNANEYIDVSIEGVSLGRLWDNDTTNDNFVGNLEDNDRGLEYGENVSTETGNPGAVAQLTQDQLNAFLADGVLSVSFDAFGAEVNNLQRDTDEFITAQVTINDATAVPEPCGWLLMMLLGTTTVFRRRKFATE